MPYGPCLASSCRASKPRTSCSSQALFPSSAPTPPNSPAAPDRRPWLFPSRERTRAIFLPLQQLACCKGKGGEPNLLPFYLVFDVRIRRPVLLFQVSVVVVGEGGRRRVAAGAPELPEVDSGYPQQHQGAGGVDADLPPRRARGDCEGTRGTVSQPQPRGRGSLLCCFRTRNSALSYEGGIGQGGG